MNEVRTVSVSIEASASVVYEFISEPSNLPHWSLFVLSAESDGDVWRVVTQAGRAQIRFVARNNLGVVDHWVRPGNAATEIYVPLRVVANEEGSQVSFTVFRLPEMDDAAFEDDVTLVQKDLSHLKAVLESRNA